MTIAVGGTWVWKRILPSASCHSTGNVSAVARTACQLVLEGSASEPLRPPLIENFPLLRGPGTSAATMLHCLRLAVFDFAGQQVGDE